MDAKTAQMRTQPFFNLLSAIWKNNPEQEWKVQTFMAAQPQRSGLDSIKAFWSLCNQAHPSSDLFPLQTGWLFTRNVVAFDEDMAEALDRTDTTQAVKREFLERLLWMPIYLPFDSMPVSSFSTGEIPVAGVLAGAFETKFADEFRIAVLLAAADGSLLKPYRLTLSAKEKENTIDSLVERAPQKADSADREVLCRVLQRVLYAASDMPEAAAWRASKAVRFPNPKKTKRGVKIFQPDKFTIAFFGEEAGKAVRRMRGESPAEHELDDSRCCAAHWQLVAGDGLRQKQLLWKLPAFVDDPKAA